MSLENTERPCTLTSGVAKIMEKGGSSIDITASSENY